MKSSVGPPRCDECGKFIKLIDLESGDARHIMVEPDSEFGPERYESLCKEHYKKSP